MHDQYKKCIIRQYRLSKLKKQYILSKHRPKRPVKQRKLQVVGMVAIVQYCHYSTSDTTKDADNISCHTTRNKLCVTIKYMPEIKILQQVQLPHNRTKLHCTASATSGPTLPSYNMIEQLREDKHYQQHGYIREHTAHRVHHKKTSYYSSANIFILLHIVLSS